MNIANIVDIKTVLAAKNSSRPLLRANNTAPLATGIAKIINVIPRIIESLINNKITG